MFHVQTEDSGVQSPHVFTHLFHGGVILSTRKLVYDAGASEDVIRSLMQAQHKATLKELRRGQYDDKIDEYLGSNPALLPRGQSGGDDEVEDERIENLRESSPRVATAQTPESRAVTRDPALHPTPTSMPVPARPQTGPLPPVGTFREGEDARPSRTSTSDSGRAASLPPLPAPPQPGRGTAPRVSAAAPPRPAITPPVVVARDLTERSDSSEIYSPPPPSAELPAGADQRGIRPPPAARPQPAAAGAPPAAPRPTPRTPTPVPLAPRNRPAGGVVMSRPAVIVGAPRTNPAPVKRPITEDERRGFGQGLISEKSLDEVILAYLSEDANDE